MEDEVFCFMSPQAMLHYIFESRLQGGKRAADENIGLHPHIGIEPRGILWYSICNNRQAHANCAGRKLCIAF